MPQFSCKQHSPKISHAQLYEILVGELTDTVVFLMDVEGCIMSWNPAVQCILGYTESEWLGRSARILFSPQEQEAGQPQRELDQAAHDGRAPDNRWHLRKDGQFRYFEGAVIALRDDAGQLLGFSKIMRDLTARKQAETELRQQWQTFDSALAHIPDFLLIFDRQGRLTYANRTLLSFWQKALEEVLGKTVFDLNYPPELAARLHGQFEQVLATSQSIPDHTPYITAEGTRYYEYICSPVWGENNKVTAVVRMTRDVTERKHLEEKLAQTQQRLQQVFEQAPVALVVFRGRDFIVELANSFYQALLQGRELVGRRFADVVPELEPAVWDAFHQVMDTGEPYIHNEFYIPYDQDRDGTIEDHWFNVVYHPLRETDDQVSGMVAVCSEVTVQVRARKDLERVNRKLEEFAYVASHDLQEPLRMVAIYSQLMIKGLPPGDEKLHQYSQIVRDGVARMQALIQDLLTYSRTVHQDALPVGVADLADALSEALSVLRERIEASGAVITAQPLPLVRGDTRQLSHVFQNLIANSLKYCREGVTPEIHISAVTREGNQVIAVRDNGIGFEQKYAQQIFGLFNRLHREEYAGTGLGLAICYRIVERYGGRIWAEGRPGEGATFFFSLPSAQTPTNDPNLSSGR
jgi:PAS domain S-box-containing protein